MASTETTPKDLMIQTIQELPDDSSYEEILRELAFSRMIERGLADSEAGRTISNEEMGRRIASYLT
jgi:predicted transcriptional regulator